MSSPMPQGNPAQQEAAKQAMARLLASSPESIIAMFDRLGIPWEKVQNVQGDSRYDTMVIKWADLMAGEKEHQKQGPFIRVLMEEMKKDMGHGFSV